MTNKVFIGHLQSGIVALATGLLGWVGITVHETRVAVAVLTDKVERLESPPQLAHSDASVSFFDTPSYPSSPGGHTNRPLALPVSSPDVRRKP